MELRDNSNPPAFHSDEFEPQSPEDAAFHIIPVPWEASVSYGSGTADGPAAILEASVQLEAYIDGGTPGDIGIHTTQAVDCSGDAETVLSRIQNATRATLDLGKLPILLGGEHALTLGPIKALLDAGIEFGVVQIDAHADLRDTYQETPYSHACVMKRIVDLGVPIFQVGIRALSLEEANFRKEKAIAYLDADTINKTGIPADLLPRNFPENIFITFDVDGLDPSIMPSTGTPEPGGLDWYQALEILEKSIEGRKVVGADVVELAPTNYTHSPDFIAAKLVYKMMDLIRKGRAIR